MSKLRFAALLLLSLAAGAALLAPLLTYPFGRDQGAFACVADVIARGGVPYRDVWEMKPPGIFYLFWASFAVFGRSTLAPRLLDLLWTLATGVTIWALGRRLLSSWVGMAGAFFFLVRYVAGHSFWNTTQCEGFASLPLTLAALMLLAAEERRSGWRAAACGALVALAVLLKFTLAIFLLLPCTALLAAQREPLRPRLARGASYLLGCLAALAGAAVLLWQAGALSDMVEIVLLWNAKYSGLEVPAAYAPSLPYQTVKFLVGTPHSLLFPIGLLALVGVAGLARGREAGRMRWLLPTWAVTMMAAVWIQGKYYTYHWLPLLPPLGLLAGEGLNTVWLLLRRATSPRAALSLYIVGLLAVLTALGAAYWSFLKWPVGYALGAVPRDSFQRAFDRYGRGDFSLSADRKVAAFLKRHTPADAPTFIWGFEPLVYYLAERPPASRFIYNVPLVTEWSPPEWRQELVRDLVQKRPRYVFVVHNDRLPWMTGQPGDSAAQLTAYLELQDVLHKRYRPTQRIEDFEVWQRQE